MSRRSASSGPAAESGPAPREGEPPAAAEPSGPVAGADPAERTAPPGDGDREGIELLLERYLADLRAFVRQRAGPLVRARESSSDLVQSVCREILEHAERFQHGSEDAFRQWLFTMALRKILNRRDFYLAEKRDALREVPLDGGGSSAREAALLEQQCRSFSTASGRAMLHEEMERVERAFESLSDEQREVVRLAHLVGLSRKEIAERLGKSEGAVRVTLHRALVRISGLLGE